MARNPDRAHPDDPQLPHDLPHDPPSDDIQDIVEFVDDDGPNDPVFTFADEATFDPPAAQASDSAPHVSQVMPTSPPPKKPKETDSVLEDEFVRIAPMPLDSDQVSGIFSSVIRQESESAVLGNSEIIRAEPLSETVALDPISEIAAMQADSDVQAVEIDDVVEPMAVEDSDIVEVMESEATGTNTSEIALPESAVSEPTHGVHEDAIGHEELPGIADSSVSLKSFRGRRSPEKEAVLDLDEGLADLDSPEPTKAARRIAPAAVEPDLVEADLVEAASDDVDFDDIVAAEIDEGSAVNLGQKPPRSTSASGIDPVAEALESGVRLDAWRAPTPSVEFDDLVVDDDIAAVDLGADSPQPGKASAMLPRTDVEDVSEMIDDVVEVEATDAEEPAVVVEDDVDISALIGSEPTEVAPAMMEADEPAAVVDEFPAEPEESAPAPSHRPPPPKPYVEPRSRSGWGSVLGGMALGVLLTVGAGAGIWFAAPDLLPKAGNTAPPSVAAATPLQQAREAIDQAKYAEAIDALKDADDKASLALRGEARWLKRLQQADVPVTPKDDEVVAALEDLMKSENQAKLQQVRLALKASSGDVGDRKDLEDKLARAMEEKEAAGKAIVEIETALRDAKLLGPADKLDPAAVDKLAKDVGDAKVSLDAVNKMLAGAQVDPSLKGIERLLTAKKDADDKLAEINKALADEKVKDAGAKGVAELIASREKAARDRDELEQAVAAALVEMKEAKLAPETGDPRKDLIAAAKAVRSKSESPLAAPLTALAGGLGSAPLGLTDFMKDAFDTTAALAEVNFYRAREAFTPTPEQQLDRLTAALANREVVNPSFAADANRLAEMVRANEAQFSVAARAKAHLAQGLALRNQKQYDPARQSLQKAAELARDVKAPWAEQVRVAYAELNDPGVYFVPRIESLRAAGDTAAALKEIDAALAVIPNHPRLKAERGLIALDVSGEEIDEASRNALRIEAEAAINDPASAAAGQFVLGRLEEQSGNFAKAEQHFRAALQAVRDQDQAAQIRLRLGRLLLRERPRAVAPAAPAQPKADDNEARATESPPAERVSMVHPLSGLVAAAMLTQVAADDPDSPEAQARVKETIDLARQLLSAKDKKIRAQGHILLGEALSRSGQRTEGIREYVKGLDLLFPESQLGRLLDEHPTFSVPESAQRANPLLAERHYGLGLHLFHQNRFAEAEDQFREAISYFDKDARYFYFLGLAEYEQGGKRKRDAALFAWDQASRLEANGRPTTREIDLALERVQGSRRALLNSYRSR